MITPTTNGHDAATPRGRQRTADITVVLDRSGSMQAIRDDAIGSFNAFVAAQRAVPGEARLTLVQFDDQYERVYEGRTLVEVADLTEQTFVPRGMTALLDAIGRTIARTDERLAAAPAQPDGVIFVILTDGQENASREFQRSQVMSMIGERERDAGWQFIFLGANQDAIAEAGGLGIDAAHAMSYDPKKMRVASDVMSSKIRKFRVSGDKRDLDFTPQERRDAGSGSG